MSAKKAQVNQGFIFIFMIIIIAAITLIGFMFFGKVRGSACDAEINTFKINMQKLSKTFSDFGTVNVRSVDAPCSYQQIYVLSTSGEVPYPVPSNIPFVIEQYLTTPPADRDNNVFLAKPDEVLPIGLIKELAPPSDENSGYYSIINREGPSFKITFEGKGKTTEISPALVE